MLTRPLKQSAQSVPALVARIFQTRDRAMDLRTWECGEPTEDLYQNVHSARNQPIRPGKLAALGAAVTPGESTEQSLYSANPFQRGAGACEWFVRKPASIYSDESCRWRTREQARLKDRQDRR